MGHVAWILLLVMATIYAHAGETDMTWEEYKVLSDNCFNALL